MNHTPDETTRVVADPADSMLISLARAVAGGGSVGGASWPKLDLADPKQREFGDYDLLEEIGRGGMGVVYRARQRSLDRDVAIKFIADWFADADGVTRFLAEARAAARLLHPNIVPVHEVGSVEGLHYFSMPLIRGRSLASVIDAGTLSPTATIALLLKLCDAIDYAHRLGLLHLDLKPANVLLDAREEPLIADFGLARHMDAKGGVDAQEVSGTPSYMAPEQILIKQYRLTPATDIYALGALLYRCLTGVSPHGDGNPDDVIRRAAAGRIHPPRELDPKIPRDLDAICMKCLELQPSDRYASVAQLTDDLRRERDGLPVSVRRVGFGERMQRWLRREPKLATAVGFAALALLAGVAATTWQWRQAAAQRDVARAERDHATIAGAIGAHLFAYSGDNDGRAGDLIAWLRKRLPGDEARQADALAMFASSVDAEAHPATQDLLAKVIHVMGADYRRREIKALQAGSDPYRHVYMAMLEWNDANGGSVAGVSVDKRDPVASKAYAAQLQAAIAEHPDDPFVWQIAAVYCPWTAGTPHCVYPQAAENLVRLDPDNMYDWLLLAAESTDPQRARAALHEAAKRTRFDDHDGDIYAAYVRANQIAAVPAPPLIARPALILAPNERPESSIARLEADGRPLVHWRPLFVQCGAYRYMPVADPQVLADCLTVGERMMRSEDGLMTRMIGVAMVYRLDKDTPLAAEATQTRRLYTYLDAMDEKLSPGQRAGYSSVRYLHDFTTAGEMVAMQRRLKFFGMPDQPPADWKPDDPMVLQSGRERYDNAIAVNRDANQLIAQGRYADAIARLAPMETGMRQFFDKNWLLARYLTTLGRARLGQRDFVTAHATLDDAWNIANTFGPGSRDARDCAQAMADLYTAWDAAEKRKGYDVMANEWKQTLATLESTKDD